MQIAKPKILVVDDEPSIRLTVQAILQQEGYEVDIAADGAAAIDAVRCRAYDLVLTDLKMPGIDGLAVLAEVRKRAPNTVTIMMTGFGSVDSAIEAVRLGAYEYLLKPADPELMKLAVRRSLERRRLSEIDTLYNLSRALTRDNDPAAVAELVCDATTRVLGVARATLVLFSPSGTPKRCDAGTTALLLHPEVHERLAAGATVASHEVPALQRWAAERNVASAALVAGLVAERLVCVLIVDNGAEAFDFHASAQRFLLNVAGQAAMAIDNATLMAELRANNRELEAANTKLRDLDKLKSQFLSVATHELRTPLSVILGYNAMLADSLADRIGDDEREVLNESVAACKRLIRMVNSMLDLTHIESGKMTMNLAPADLRSAVNSVVTLLGPDARHKRITLLVNAPAQLPKAHVDAERVEQVLVNLIGNALKFTPDGGRVTVSLRHRPDTNSVEIAVCDTGIGIAPEDQAMIFDEFAQVRKQAANRQREGSGLGLAIAKRIVEAHNGELRVESAPGRGSTFSATFPIKARKPQSRSATTA